MGQTTLLRMAPLQRIAFRLPVALKADVCACIWVDRWRQSPLKGSCRRPKRGARDWIKGYLICQFDRYGSHVPPGCSLTAHWLLQTDDDLMSLFCFPDIGSSLV
jgi:hypothetical protein